MMLTGPQVISDLRSKLQVNIGRHLYGVLGTYARLAHFEEVDLKQALDADGRLLPAPLNLNRELLATLPDEDLRRLVKDEARRPQAVERRLNEQLRAVLTAHLQHSSFVILEQLELIFAYNLDLSIFRTCAANEHHLLLLLPGERRSEHILLFHEASERFQRTLPDNLIADNHLWELTHA